MPFIPKFSKLTPTEKLKIVASYLKVPEDFIQACQSFLHTDAQQQKIFETFSENTLTNFLLPYGVAPNFLIDGKYYVVPMVTEESAVVAAAANAAKFWAQRGGFQTKVIATTKIGHVHFIWHGEYSHLYAALPALKKYILAHTASLTTHMQQRGGGIKEIDLINSQAIAQDYYQLKVQFETCDAMGANFINACLEEIAHALKIFVAAHSGMQDMPVDIVMSILSNYTPHCIVKSTVACEVAQLGPMHGMRPEAFVKKFSLAVKIAQNDVYRAVTHNKGIFNGITAVTMATGNDFRAIEANGHAYAAHSGAYRSLTTLHLADNIFKYELTLPLALGVVGGLTQLHLLVKWSLKLLKNPNAATLMKIAVSVGLASNFSAVQSLITTGIQQGHMKMHLANILHHLKASDAQKQKALCYFDNQPISFAAVRAFINTVKP